MRSFGGGLREFVVSESGAAFIDLRVWIGLAVSGGGSSAPRCWFRTFLPHGLAANAVAAGIRTDS